MAISKATAAALVAGTPLAAQPTKWVKATLGFLIAGKPVAIGEVVEVSAPLFAVLVTANKAVACDAPKAAGDESDDSGDPHKPAAKTAKRN